jgi:hypothetical protein
MSDSEDMSLDASESGFYQTWSTEEQIDADLCIQQKIHDYCYQHILGMSHPDFTAMVVDAVATQCFDEWTDMKLCSSADYHSLVSLVSEQVDVFLECNGTIPRRSEETNDEECKIATTSIDHVLHSPQCLQRSPEWFQVRRQYLTASNLYKAFGTPAQYNSLVFEKCSLDGELVLEAYQQDNEKDQQQEQQDQEDQEDQEDQQDQEDQEGQEEQEDQEDQDVKVVFTDLSLLPRLDNPRAFGQRYEPLSRQIYEVRFGAQVKELGCIPHRRLSFLAASPDGINIQQGPRFGRLIEIKNIVNREINGVPSAAYWIQMQTQMEVCDVDRCDFVETRFLEYPSALSFFADRPSPETHGIIHYLVARGSEGFYVYSPFFGLDLADENEVDAWTQHVMAEHPQCSLYTTFYWRLDCFSCVLVKRNRLWFAAAEPILVQLWETILHERQTGYHHRAPTKRKITNPTPVSSFLFHKMSH